MYCQTVTGDSEAVRLHPVVVSAWCELFPLGQRGRVESESNQTRITTRGVHPHELEAIMSTDRTLELLERVFELPPGSLSPADAIADRWESIAVLGFMAAVDEEFSVVLSPQKLAACQTAQDVADLVRGHAS